MQYLFGLICGLEYLPILFLRVSLLYSAFAPKPHGNYLGILHFPILVLIRGAIVITPKSLRTGLSWDVARSFSEVGGWI